MHLVLDSASLSGLSDDVLSEMMRYLNAGAIARLYGTFDARLQRKISQPGLIRSLVMNYDMSVSNGMLAYLLEHLPSLETLVLDRTKALSVPLLKTLVASSPHLRNLTIGSAFVEVFQSDIGSVLLDSTELISEGVISKIPLRSAGPNFVPDFRLLFPSLEVLRLSSSLRYLVTFLAKLNTPARPYQNEDAPMQMVCSVLPNNLRELKLCEHGTIDLELKDIYKLLPNTLTHLELSMATSGNFSLSRISASFPSLRTLILETRETIHQQPIFGGPAANESDDGEREEKFQTLPASLTRLQLYGVDSCVTLRERLIFTNLVDLKHVAFNMGSKNAPTLEKPTFDLRALLSPTSVQSLHIATLEPILRALPALHEPMHLGVIASLPTSLTTLELGSPNCQCPFSRIDIRHLLPLVASLESLTTFIDHTPSSPINWKTTKTWPKSLTRLHVDSQFLKDVHFASTMEDGTALCFRTMDPKLEEEVRVQYELLKNLRFLRCFVSTLRCAFVHLAINHQLILESTTKVPVDSSDERLLQLAGLKKPIRAQDVDFYAQKLTKGRLATTSTIVENTILASMQKPKAATNRPWENF